MISKKIVMLSELDNVGVATQDIVQNEDCEIIGTQKHLKALDDVKFGHKIAIDDIQDGSSITKYGETIGTAVHLISKGKHVHIHNMKNTIE